MPDVLNMDAMQSLIEEHVNTLTEKGVPLATPHQIPSENLEEIYRAAYNYCHENQFNRAIIYFTYLVMYQPYDRRFHLGLGVAMQRGGQYEQAAKSFTMALLMDATDPGPTLQIAECLIKLNMLQDAREALQTTIQQSYIDTRHASLREYAQILLETLV